VPPQAPEFHIGMIMQQGEALRGACVLGTRQARARSSGGNRRSLVSEPPIEALPDVHFASELW
jgi:hypothetical protein